MPTVFRKNGYRFFFYSNDHRPIHVHVTYEGGEAVFYIEEEVILRESHNMKVKSLSQAEKLARENKQLIIDKWHEYFD